MRILILTLVFTYAATPGESPVDRAPAWAAEKRNPFEGSDRAQRAGAKLYAQQCASCHGNHREGGRKAPPLSQPEVQKAPSGTLFWVLRNGSLHQGMPSFAHLPEAQRWQIVTYLQSADR
jgi:mono/diheme cytochrome c family protein